MGDSEPYEISMIVFNGAGLVAGILAFMLTLSMSSLTDDIAIRLAIASVFTTVFACCYDRYPQGVTLRTFADAMNPVEGGPARVAVCLIPLILSTYVIFLVGLGLCILARYEGGYHFTAVFGIASLASALLTLLLRVVLRVGRYETPSLQSDENSSDH